MGDLRKTEKGSLDLAILFPSHIPKYWKIRPVYETTFFGLEPAIIMLYITILESKAHCKKKTCYAVAENAISHVTKAGIGRRANYGQSSARSCPALLISYYEE